MKNVEAETKWFLNADFVWDPGVDVIITIFGDFCQFSTKNVFFFF
jgi:hypothetical protein